jgi:hypothetical protein
LLQIIVQYIPLSYRHTGDAVWMERLEWPHTQARVVIQKPSNIVDQSLLLPMDCCKTEHSPTFL